MRAIFLTTRDDTADEFRKLFAANFPKIKIEFFETELEALEDINNVGDVELVFIDANDKNMAPRPLANKISEVAGDVTRVFVGNPANVNARAYPGYDIIPEKEDEKTLAFPVDKDAFISTIQSIIERVEEENIANAIIEGMDEDFLPIKVRNFFMYKAMPHDVFVKLTKEKYSLVMQQGKKYSHRYIYNYIKKQVRYFYLQKNEHIKAMESLMAEVAKELSKEGKLEIKKQVELQVRGISLVQEYIKLIGISDQVILLTKLLVDSTLLTFKKLKKERDIITYIDFSYLDAAEKSLLTFKVCDSIIRGMKWDAKLTKTKLGLASIIHDSTITNEDMYRIADVNDPNLLVFDREEQEKFRQHPQDAARIASYFTDVPEVDFIIGQHHEMPDGSGFPNKLNSHTLTSLSAIFILANNFVGELYRTSLTEKSLSRIMKKFEKYDKGNFKPPLKILNDIIKSQVI